MFRRSVCHSLFILSLALSCTSCEASTRALREKLIADSIRDKAGEAVDAVVDGITGNDTFGDIAEIVLEGIIDAINIVDELIDKLREENDDEEEEIAIVDQFDGPTVMTRSIPKDPIKQIERAHKIQALEKDKHKLQESIAKIEKTKIDQKPATIAITSKPIKK